MRGASGSAKNEKVAKRDHMSAEGQGLISGVKMGERVREAGIMEGKANGQRRENDTRSDNSREEEQEESFQVHNIRGVCY